MATSEPARSVSGVASRGGGRRSASAWWIRAVIVGDSSPREELVDRLEDGLEEVGVALAEDAEVLVGVADEGAEHPGHLRADEAKDDHPDLEDRADARVELPGADALERTG